MSIQNPNNPIFDAEIVQNNSNDGKIKTNNLPNTNPREVGIGGTNVNTNNTQTDNLSVNKPTTSTNEIGRAHV